MSMLSNMLGCDSCIFTSPACLTPGKSHLAIGNALACPLIQAREGLSQGAGISKYEDQCVCYRKQITVGVDRGSTCGSEQRQKRMTT